MKEKTIGKNEIERNYILFGKKNSALIDQNKPITLVCNGKVYSGKAFDKQRYIIYANQEFFEEQMIELGDHLIFDIDSIGNTIRITVLKRQRKNETYNFDKTKAMNNETKPILNKPNISKEEFLELIEELRTTFKENEWCFRTSEENVRAELIDPILKALGWRMPYLRREFNRMDYILCEEKTLKKDSIKLIIEAKKYREQLLTDKPEESKKQQNQQQIRTYMENEDLPCRFGILTNGIRWCLFIKGINDCIGEIDINKSSDENIYRFFNSISITGLKNIDHLSWNWLNSPLQENRPTKIIIDEERYKTQKEAIVKIAKDFIDNINHPKDYCFTQRILIEKTDNHNEIKYKKHIINHYRGVYEQITLIKEINSTLNLNLKIEVK